ncbi:MAG TPA: response regulator [Vulgatibacter sp.]|nr:response regulator [Vulgatibacter sp.]
MTASSASLAGRVLLIDDDQNFHPLVGKVVESLGHSFVAVRSGEEGLQRIESALPRALILDGLLPGMRGEDVAKRLRKKYSSEQLPIVFVTAFYRDIKSYKFLTNECGVDALLHKPLVPDQLRAVLSQILEPTPLDVEIEVDTEGLRPDDEEHAELLADYLAGTREKIEGMRAAFQSLGGSQGLPALRSLRMDAHRLRGSGTSFGFPEITRLAGAIEDLIDRAGDDLLLPGPRKAQLDGLLEALDGKIQATVGAAPIALSRARGWRPRVLLVETGGPLVEEMASIEDDALRLCADVESAIEAAIDDRPDVVVLGPDVGGAEACARMRAAGIGPVVMMSRGDSLAERLMATEAGAVGYVARPPNVEGLFRVASIFARPRVGTRIVVAGGERVVLTGIAEALAPFGVAVDPAPEPDEMLSRLERLSPALVVLDVDSWKVGPQLLRVQRADLRLRSVPVVALSSQEERRALLEAGAVAVIPKPFDPEELAAVVVAHLLQRQHAEASRGRDPLTGLYDRAYLRQVLERSVALARREGRTLAVAGVDANVEPLRERAGSLVVDEVLSAYAAHLKSAFRESDVVARIGPARFAVLLHSVRRLDVERLMARQLEDFRKTDLGIEGFVPEPVGALAAFPETSMGPDALLESVDAKLNAALQGKARPRSR